MKQLFTILILMTCIMSGYIPVVNSAGQSMMLEGSVLNTETGKSMPDVQVTTDSGVQTHSSRTGRFRLNVPAPGPVTIKFTKEGFGMVEKRVPGQPGDTVTLQVFMTRMPSYTDEVTVEAGPFPNVEPVDVVSPHQVQNIPGAFEDTMQTLRFMPGVISGDDFTARLFVRGGRPDQNGIYLDGIPINDPYRLFGFTSLFNPETLKYVKLYPGGFDVQYGDRLSAVIEVENRHGALDRRLTGSANVSLTNMNFIGEGRLFDSFPSSWLISARRTYFDLLLESMDSEDISYPGFTDAQGLFYFQPSPRHEWFLTILASKEDSNITGDIDKEKDNPDYVDLTDDQKNFVAGLNGSHMIKDNFRLSYLLSSNKNNQSSDIFFREGDTSYESSFNQNLESKDIYFRPKMEYYLGNHAILAGAEFNRSDNIVTFDINTEDPRIDIPDELLHFDETQHFRKYAAYLQDAWELIPDVELKAGVRWDESTLSDMNEWSPRVSLRWKPAPRWELRSAWGYYYQFPSYQSLQGDGYFLDLRGIKDLHLKPEKAIHYLLNTTYESPNRWEVSVDAYYKELDNLLESGEELETILVLDDQDQVFEYTRDSDTFIPENSRSGYARGLDVTFTLNDTPTRPFYGMMTYTFSQARSHKTGEQDKWESWDRRHNLTLTGGWKINPRWEVGWKWRYSSGAPYTPVTKVIRVVDDSNENGQYDPEEGEAFSWQRDDPDSAVRSQRLPDYHRLDLRIQYQKKYSRMDVQYYLDIINVYGNNNVQGYDYNPEYTERENINGMPFLPSFGVKVKF